MAGHISRAASLRPLLVGTLLVLLAAGALIAHLMAGGVRPGLRSDAAVVPRLVQSAATATPRPPTAPPARVTEPHPSRAGVPRPRGARPARVTASHPPRASDAVAARPAFGEVPDPAAAQSAPAPPSVHHAAAVSPASAAATVATGAPSDAQVRNELRSMNAAVSAENAQAASGALTPVGISGNGTVSPPTEVPQVISRLIAGANAITNFPYVFGGGHGSFVDNAYDCSGSVSYALAAAGLLSIPETSGALESWGAPGRGRWLTVYANAGHVYMFVDGLRYDTAGRTGVFSTRWQTGPDPVGGPGNTGFVARHYPGL